MSKDEWSEYNDSRQRATKEAKHNKQLGRRALERKKNARTIIIVVGVFLILAAVVGYWNNYNHFIFKKSLDKTVFTVEDDPITLKQVSYYIMLEEEHVNDLALIYNEENPLAYWNIHVDHEFVSETAAGVVLDYAIQDEMYSREAKAAGVMLTDEEIQEGKLKAADLYGDMTEKQKDQMEYSQADWEEAILKNSLADKYIQNIAQDKGITMENQVLQGYFGSDSNNYKELYKKYKVEVNTKLWENVSVGRVTIN